jgi:hypothetical protein
MQCAACENSTLTSKLINVHHRKRFICDLFNDALSNSDCTRVLRMME